MSTESGSLVLFNLIWDFEKSNACVDNGEADSVVIDVIDRYTFQGICYRYLKPDFNFKVTKNIAESSCSIYNECRLGQNRLSILHAYRGN